MAPLEIRHRSVRPISAKHAQASRFLQQSQLADLIVLERNFLQVPEATLGENRVLMTMVGGSIIHDSGKVLLKNAKYGRSD
jgi:hypothetical protein